MSVSVITLETNCKHTKWLFCQYSITQVNVCRVCECEWINCFPQQPDIWQSNSQQWKLTFLSPQCFYSSPGTQFSLFWLISERDGLDSLQAARVPFSPWSPGWDPVDRTMSRAFFQVWTWNGAVSVKKKKPTLSVQSLDRVFGSFQILTQSRLA